MPTQIIEDGMNWWNLVRLCRVPFGTLPDAVLECPVPASASVPRAQGLDLLDRFGGNVQVSIDGGIQYCRTLSCRWPISLGAMARRYRFESLLSMHERTYLDARFAADAWLGNDNEGPWVPREQLAEFLPAQFRFMSALRSALAIRKACGTTPVGRDLAPALANLAEAAAEVDQDNLLNVLLSHAMEECATEPSNVPDGSYIDSSLDLAHRTGKALSHLWAGHPRHALFILDEFEGVPAS